MPPKGEMITAAERAMIDKLLEDKKKRLKWAADYYRRRYAKDAEFVVKKVAYKQARYANDAAFGEATKARVADNCARSNALMAIRYLFEGGSSPSPSDPWVTLFFEGYRLIADGLLARLSHCISTWPIALPWGGVGGRSLLSLLRCVHARTSPWFHGHHRGFTDIAVVSRTSPWFHGHRRGCKLTCRLFTPLWGGIGCRPLLSLLRCVLFWGGLGG